MIHYIYIYLYIYIYIYIYIYMLVGFGRKREAFNKNEMHVEPRFPCDCVTPGNGYSKRMLTSTAEIKRVYFVFLNHKLHTKNEDERPM